MSKKDIVKELVEQFFNFDNEFQGEKGYTMTDFVGYLNVRYAVQPLTIRNIAGEEEKWIKEDDDANTDISTLLVFMYRYAVVYFKKALKEATINTLDEFSFLIVLMTYSSLSKTELIQKLIMEKTSGVEVIKRLLKNGLIEEFANPNDKRSVLVAITAKGKEELALLFPKMGLVGSVIVGNLTSSEISSFSFLLRKLDYYHNDIFLNHRNLSLEELQDRKDL